MRYVDRLFHRATRARHALARAVVAVVASASCSALGACHSDDGPPPSGPALPVGPIAHQVAGSPTPRGA